MVLEAPGRPLELADRSDPAPGPGQVLIDVAACGVCRTDLHLLDGEVGVPRLPVVPGHQVVGRVIKAGPGAAGAPRARGRVAGAGRARGVGPLLTTGRGKPWPPA